MRAAHADTPTRATHTTPDACKNNRSRLDAQKKLDAEGKGGGGAKVCFLFSRAPLLCRAPSSPFPTFFPPSPRLPPPSPRRRAHPSRPHPPQGIAERRAGLNVVCSICRTSFMSTQSKAQLQAHVDSKRAYLICAQPPTPALPHPTLFPAQTPSKHLTSASPAGRARLHETLPFCCCRLSFFSSKNTFWSRFLFISINFSRFALRA